MNTLNNDAVEHWRYVAPLLKSPVCEADFHRLVEALDELLDNIGDDETHTLAALVEHLGDLVSGYEHTHDSMLKGEGRTALAFLVEQHGLSQSDLPEIGAQSMISEILSGKRQLNIRRIRALSERFGMSPVAFSER